MKSRGINNRKVTFEVLPSLDQTKQIDVGITDSTMGNIKVFINNLFTYLPMISRVNSYGDGTSHKKGIGFSV